MEAVTAGSSFSLARWFQIPEDVSGPYDDFARDEILNDLYANAKTVAVYEGTVLVETDAGAAMIETDPGGVVVFDYVRNDRWTRTRFWMNASSVADLGEKLRSLPRRPFADAFVGAVSS